MARLEQIEREVRWDLGSRQLGNTAHALAKMGLMTNAAGDMRVGDEAW